MNIYIASSWKNQHAVELLTSLLRDEKHTVLSFIENNYGEKPRGQDMLGDLSFDKWCATEKGRQSFEYDTRGATQSDLVIYIGPSGCDAWAEVGAAWASRIPIYALQSKGEAIGLMRRMADYWFDDFRVLLDTVASMQRMRK